MSDSERMEWRRQQIFELALNIARLKLHGCYMEQGELILVSHDAVESYIRSLTEQLEHAANSALMAGDWR